MPIVSTAKMTAQQFLQLGEDPPGIRLELVNGEVAVSPSPIPDHARVVMKLSSLLDTYIEKNGLGELYADVDTILDRLTVRRPDILFFSTERTYFVGEKAMEGPPDLAIEVISLSSVEIDRDDKFAEYRDAGVSHYWIVDPADRTVESWTLVDGQYVDSGRAQGVAVLRLPPYEQLDISLERLWRK